MFGGPQIGDRRPPTRRACAHDPCDAATGAAAVPRIAIYCEGAAAAAVAIVVGGPAADQTGGEMAPGGGGRLVTERGGRDGGAPPTKVVI